MEHVARHGGGTDKRFRRTMTNVPRGNGGGAICGAEIDPAGRAWTMAEGSALIRNARLRPDWLANVCPDCIAKLQGGVV